MIKLISTLIFLYVLCFQAVAQTSLAERVRGEAAQHVKNNTPVKKNQRVSVEAVNIDPRTDFQQCQSFHYYITSDEVKSNTTVRVTCDESPQFRIYVPVRVTWLIPVIAMKKSADRGTSLDEGVLKISYVDNNKVYGGYYTAIDQLLGAKLKRRIRHDEVINRHDICIVCRGDPVKIVAQGKGFYLSTMGTALSDGHINDTIRVKNTHSQRTIRAVISAVGKVKIQM